ncbi:MAG: MoaD/ThiS family protein [Candidatus Thorarchaeota archaeon]
MYMQVAIRFRGPVGKRMRTPIFHVEIGENATIHNLFETLLQKEENVNEIWGSPESIDSKALVLLNEVDIGLTGGLETKLSNGDEIVVLPLVHGG